MINLFLLLISIGLLFCSPASGADYIYDIDKSEGFDLSGLAICDERLYAIADNDDFSIFELLIKPNKSAQLIKVNSFTPPSIPYPGYSYMNIVKMWLQSLTGKRYDWEGITCHNKQLVLVSEAYSALYRVHDNTWHPIDVKHIMKQGLMSKYGAYFEGVTINPKGIFLAVEREPRGIVHYDTNNRLHIGKTDESYDASGLPADWSDITYWNNELFGLYRNMNKVCRIDIKDLSEAECVSFADQTARIKYDSADRYGMAEGLAMNDENIFVVMDNNRKARINTANDNRSVLIVIKNAFNASR